MEKTTKFLRMIGALLTALSAGLLLAQRIKEAVREAEKENATEDAVSKLERVMEAAAKQSREGQV